MPIHLSSPSFSRVRNRPSRLVSLEGSEENREVKEAIVIAKATTRAITNGNLGQSSAIKRNGCRNSNPCRLAVVEIVERGIRTNPWPMRTQSRSVRWAGWTSSASQLHDDIDLTVIPCLSIDLCACGVAYNVCNGNVLLALVPGSL